MKRFLKRDLILLRAELSDPSTAALFAERPKTCGDCVGGERPCPWVGCRWNLFLDVSKRAGAIKYNRPGLEPDQMPPEASCTLDIADRGGATLEEVGALMNMTRERVRQIEENGSALFRDNPTAQALAGEIEKGRAHSFEESDDEIHRDGSGSLLSLLDAIPSDEELRARFRGAPVRRIIERIGEVVPSARKRKTSRVYVLQRNRPRPAPGEPRFAETVVIGTVPPVPSLIGGDHVETAQLSEKEKPMRARGKRGPNGLTDLQRDTLALYEQGDSFEEIAKHVGSTRDGVQMCICKLRKRGLVKRPGRATGKRGADRVKAPIATDGSAKGIRYHWSSIEISAVGTVAAESTGDPVIAILRERIAAIEARCAELDAHYARLVTAMQAFASDVARSLASRGKLVEEVA